MPPGRSCAAPARSSSACLAASSASSPRRGCQRRSGRACSVPRPLQGGSTSTRSNGLLVAELAGVGLHDLRRCSRPSAGRSRLQRPRAAGMHLDRNQLALAPHQRRQVRGLAAGSRAEIEHPLPGLRRRARAPPPPRRATAASAAPCLNSSEPNASKRAVEHQHLGQLGQPGLVRPRPAPSCAGAQRVGCRQARPAPARASLAAC